MEAYELEQIIDQYKEYIIKRLESKISKLENNQRHNNINI